MSKFEEQVMQALEQTDEIFETISTVKGDNQVSAVSFACTMKAYIDLNVTFLHSLNISDDAFETYTEVSTLIAVKLMGMYTQQLGLGNEDVAEALRAARSISERVQAAVGDLSAEDFEDDDESDGDK